MTKCIEVRTGLETPNTLLHDMFNIKLISLFQGIYVQKYKKHISV